MYMYIDYIHVRICTYVNTEQSLLKCHNYIHVFPPHTVHTLTLHTLTPHITLTHSSHITLTHSLTHSLHTLTATEAFCGNGILEGEEQCDQDRCCDNETCTLLDGNQCRCEMHVYTCTCTYVWMYNVHTCTYACTYIRTYTTCTYICMCITTCFRRFNLHVHVHVHVLISSHMHFQL